MLGWVVGEAAGGGVVSGVERIGVGLSRTDVPRAFEEFFERNTSVVAQDKKRDELGMQVAFVPRHVTLTIPTMAPSSALAGPA